MKMRPTLFFKEIDNLVASKSNQKKIIGNQYGQGMMEYIIIVALIAVAAIGVYAAFGKTVRLQTAGVANEVAGKKIDMTLVKDAGNEAGGRANDPKKEGLGQYNYANDQK